MSIMDSPDVVVNLYHNDFITVICEESIEFLACLARENPDGHFLVNFSKLDKGRHVICLCHIKDALQDFIYVWQTPLLYLKIRHDTGKFIDVGNSVFEDSNGLVKSKVIKIKCKKRVSSLRYLAACQVDNDRLVELRTLCSRELQLHNFLLSEKSELKYYSVECVLGSTCSCDLSLL
jgi:hypothetical protein